MWVWSDDLVSRFPEIRSGGSTPVPLLAVEVGADTDLEAVARAVIGEYQPGDDRATSERERPAPAAR
jgi:hypothetical protein